MYQGTKIAFKNALFLVFFKVQKTSNLRVLVTRRENALLGNIFTFLCCTCDTKHTCKRSFQLTQATFSESDVNMSKFLAEFIAVAARKPQFYFLSDSSKSKTLWQVLVLVSKIVHQRVSPDKIWRNPWFQFWKSILDIYSPLVLRGKIYLYQDQ